MELKDKELKKYEVIEKVVNNEITKKDAEKQLNLCRKQINRLVAAFIHEGKDGFIHKNRGKTNKNKKDPKIIDKVKELYLTEYFDYNFEAFYEEIENKYNISYSTMYNAFLDDDIISPIAHRKTTKLYNEKMQKTIAEINKNEKYLSLKVNSTFVLKVEFSLGLKFYLTRI